MQPGTGAEKELRKENLYLNRVQELLRKHRGSLRAAYEPSADALKDGEDRSLLKQRYAAETAIIDRIMANERSALLSGVALGGLVFASVRYGPRFIVTRLNPDKARMLKEADEVAEKANTRWIQKSASLLFEAGFGLWGGWRGYSVISSQNSSSYDEIAKIPLCAGRSAVSENVCPEWVDLVRGEIPPALWKNLEKRRAAAG